MSSSGRWYMFLLQRTKYQKRTFCTSKVIVLQMCPLCAHQSTRHVSRRDATTSESFIESRVGHEINVDEKRLAECRNRVWCSLCTHFLLSSLTTPDAEVLGKAAPAYVQPVRNIPQKPETASKAPSSRH